MQAKERALLVARAADTKKASRVQLMHVTELTAIADYFVICDGGSHRQVQAIVDGIEEALAEAGEPVRHIEGYDVARWVLIDLGDVLVHVFHERERPVYDLERLWGEAPCEPYPMASLAAGSAAGA